MYSVQCIECHFQSHQGQFEAPLGGGTALDLLESFGFEGGLESITQEPASPTYGLPFRRRSCMFLNLIKSYPLQHLFLPEITILKIILHLT